MTVTFVKHSPTAAATLPRVPSSSSVQPPTLCAESAGQASTLAHPALAGRQRPLQRSASAPALAVPGAAELQVDQARDDALTQRFGSSQPARGKVKTDAQGQVIRRCPIQKQEMEPAYGDYRRVRVNPTRVFVAEHAAPDGRGRLFIRRQADLDARDRSDGGGAAALNAAAAADPAPAGGLAAQLRLDDLRAHKVRYKWDIAPNGSLVIGEVLVGAPPEVAQALAAQDQAKAANPEKAKEKQKEKVKDTAEKEEKAGKPDKVAKKKPEDALDPRAFMQGHVTLVGGSLVASPWQSTAGFPHARISGLLYARADGSLCINNDSGRFSEYEDRRPEHLEQVAALFGRAGVPVAVAWVEKKPIALARPTGNARR
ncbi:XopV/AopV family type III secretion system effector [Acidovorax sp. SUPP1855]|uniref:XopV/AopV family type III secretion system effector n=1 Tax=Acidovorax sp. SUPP1855 TaxID=431774 RepID=UPI0023DE296F|nr:XopV/AopV family type III secretion system effector [Acidovorax sp. SUPP1855]GKS95785.1 hypothetical protein AVAK2825_14640 [Acidovorax sp. SUPP2825]